MEHRYESFKELTKAAQDEGAVLYYPTEGLRNYLVYFRTNFDGEVEFIKYCNFDPIRFQLCESCREGWQKSIHKTMQDIIEFNEMYGSKRFVQFEKRTIANQYAMLEL